MHYQYFLTILIIIEGINFEKKNIDISIVRIQLSYNKLGTQLVKKLEVKTLLNPKLL